MQMRITILDFVSFVSMTWKVKISQTQECPAGSSGCLPHTVLECLALWGVESDIHSDVVAGNAIFSLRHQQHTSFWEGDIASVFLRTQQLSNTLHFFLNIRNCGIILDSRYSGDICYVFEWTCLMLVCCVHVLWLSGSFSELLRLAWLRSGPSRLMQSTCHSAVAVLRGCLEFYEVLVF